MEPVLAADPNNREWRLDIVALNRALAMRGDDPARRFELIVSTLKSIEFVPAPYTRADRVACRSASGTSRSSHPSEFHFNVLGEDRFTPRGMHELPVRPFGLVQGPVRTTGPSVLKLQRTATPLSDVSSWPIAPFRTHALNGRFRGEADIVPTGWLRAGSRSATYRKALGPYQNRVGKGKKPVGTSAWLNPVRK